MTKYLLSILRPGTLAVLLTLLVWPAAAAVLPSAAPVVDGQITDWNLTTDWVSQMHRAWKASKEYQSDLYLRYDCATQTMFVLVLTRTGYPGLLDPTLSWIKATDLGNATIVSGTSDNNGVPPDFAWVGVGFDGNPNHVQGFEASFPLTPGPHTIKAHIEIEDSGPQTS
ncbi:MAG TPA: hypothetical protein PLG50_02675, partial [bacterium]|nr:hypothetical protein [bacterium]